MAVAKIGAVNVGSIETLWHGEVTPPAGRVVRKWVYNKDEAEQFNKGDEIGRFNMGSTVILLFANADMNWNDGFYPQKTVKMGEQIGNW
jgi:phosphatidylserine decarboxylase